MLVALSCIMVIIFCLAILVNLCHKNKNEEQWTLNSEYGICDDYAYTKKKINNHEQVYTEVIIAIIDTGVDLSHEDLQGVSWKNTMEIENGLDDDGNGYIDDIYGWNFCQNNSIVNAYIDIPEENAHGTACAGIIAANDNGIGICGVSALTGNVKLMPLKVLDGIGKNTGSIQSLVDAIHYAESNGAKICNLSLNTTTYSEDLQQAIKNSKMLFVVSAGNGMKHGIDIDKQLYYPSAFDLDNVITVAAIDQSGIMVDNSNYGVYSVDLVAPGKDILTTVPNNNYKKVSGTSFAAPHVTAAAAVLYSFFPNASPKEIKQKLLNACKTNLNLCMYINQGRILSLDNIVQLYCK